ncbi:hypothetical protein AtNW77_Chr5g0116751 [Arabidopsis thaliana]|uniref:Uncharacterized protein n=2 Tax=Arabidopsis thaliana TaxID=3702 RepID=A0A654G636_ARATH|nr:mto 1 responding up 1 [Arabidopsis thaliana]AED93973.2 mto 1 responding up 1 [Arabidopsis thaliana]CAA0405592.1 unnamed protein product [Arabidopsis thaliana]VYS68334.1 unnamed protein product [Arabidopsis thaliana]|eukprot:NP_001318676.1 mto 1 responding up 1 [Arabidopsis thaliana]
MGRENQIAVNLLVYNNRLIHQLTRNSNHFLGRSGSPTIILEAIAYYDLWI